MEDKKTILLKSIEEYKKKKEEEKKEMEEHPERFKPKWPYELFGIECGEGWEHLYKPLIEYVEKYNIGKEGKDRIEIHQIKEKFGGLRFYTNFYTDELRKMILEAEEKSFSTCEVCGKHIDKPITENHWIYAECQECHDKWKKDRHKKIDEAYEKKMIKHNLENN
jgi:ribosomal protein L37AE/L43A